MVGLRMDTLEFEQCKALAEADARSAGQFALLMYRRGLADYQRETAGASTPGVAAVRNECAWPALPSLQQVRDGPHERNRLSHHANSLFPMPGHHMRTYVGFALGSSPHRLAGIDTQSECPSAHVHQG